MFRPVILDARSVVLVFAVVATGGVNASACSGRTRSSETTGTERGPTTERAEFRIHAFGQVLGSVAPCGCTTEPLGGLPYAFGHLEASGDPAARLVLEPGSFLFPDPDGPMAPVDAAAWAQANARARILRDRFAAEGDHLVSGIGPTDVASPAGREALATSPLPRVAANLEVPELPRDRLVTLRDHGITWTVGVTAVVDPELPGAAALGRITPAAPALTAQAAAMRSHAADFVIALAHGKRAFAETLAREAVGVDAIVIAIPEGIDRERLGEPPVRIGNTWLLAPGNQLQALTELRLSVDAALPGVPESAEWTLVPARDDVLAELARVEERLGKWKADPTADPAFLARLEAERTRLTASLAQAPEGPAIVSVEQVKVTCKLPVDEDARRALADYDAQIAHDNATRFAGQRAPAPAPGQPAFAGTEACNDCHAEAVEFWRGTVHARAYATLERDTKQFDLECVGCHVTGFRKPGGSEVVENAGLRDVQCEACHGPGSLHVADGGDDPRRIRLEVPADLCVGECHTREHSDTFEYEAYLRDILGVGHGEAARQRLGDGPTGHTLRQAGLEKAGGACKKKM